MIGRYIAMFIAFLLGEGLIVFVALPGINVFGMVCWAIFCSFQAFISWKEDKESK